MRKLIGLTLWRIIRQRAILLCWIFVLRRRRLIEIPEHGRLVLNQVFVRLTSFRVNPEIKLRFQDLMVNSIFWIQREKCCISVEGQVWLHCVHICCICLRHWRQRIARYHIGMELVLVVKFSMKKISELSNVISRTSLSISLCPTLSLKTIGQGIPVLFIRLFMIIIWKIMMLLKILNITCVVLDLWLMLWKKCYGT